MKRKNRLLFALTAVLLALATGLTPTGQLTAAVILNENYSFVQSTPSADIISLAAGTDEGDSTDRNDEINKAEQGDSATQDNAVDPDDVLPDPDSTEITEDPTPGERDEAEGTTIIPVTLNNIIRDALPDSVSVNVYTFTLSERGVLMYSFNHTGAEEASCTWHITLYEEYSPDGTGNTYDFRELYRLSYTSMGTAAVSPLLGLTPGNYRISVRCISGYTQGKFDFAVGFSPSADYETEPNNSRSRYTELPLNKTLNGSASTYGLTSTDEDWFMFQVTRQGYCVLTFEHARDETGNSANFIAWRIQITDMEGREYFYTTSALGELSKNSGIMGLEPGYYFISVTSHVETAATYSITASFAADEAIERELNETMETAAPIAPNAETVGSLTERYAAADRDFYKFSLEEEGYIVLQFLHEALLEDHSGWSVSILDSRGSIIYSSISNWTQAILQTPYIGLPTGDYYIRIDSDNLYRSSIVYRLLLVVAADDTWETEPNGTVETADDIEIGTPINGSMSEAGVSFDTDYFTFTTPEPAELSISFAHSPSQETEREGWSISLLDSNGELIDSAASMWSDSQTSFTSFVPPGRYYIMVETGLYFNDQRYELTITRVH